MVLVELMKQFTRFVWNQNLQQKRRKKNVVRYFPQSEIPGYGVV